jgi:hypothetical protein
MHHRCKRRQACVGVQLCGRARDGLAHALAVLVELEYDKLVGRGRFGGHRFVEGALGLLPSVELADQVSAGEECEDGHVLMVGDASLRRPARLRGVRPAAPRP